MPIRPPTHKPFPRTTPVYQAQKRESSTKRGYGYRWQKVRESYLRSHPLCVECQKEGKVTPATDLDHIRPHKGDMAAFWDSSNWAGLCRSCHSKKTASEDGGFGNNVRNT